MTTEHMRALVLEDYGAPFVYRVIDRPKPDYGEVLIRVKASGVNPLDAKIKAGEAEHAKQPLPAVLGIDMAGVVVEVGEGVTSYVPGDKVFGMTGGVAGLQGSLAEYVAVDAELIARKPANLTMREAAAIPFGFVTAWEGLVDKAKIVEGQKVLIHGGSGGIGQMAIQIARAFGADVYATDTADKKAIIEWFGATHIDHEVTTIAEYVDKYTRGAGFDIVFDTIGGTTLDASFEAVKQNNGHVISSLGWGSHSLAPLTSKAATYSGVFTLLPMLTGMGREHHGAILREATRMAEAGQILPLLDPRHFHLQTADQALTLIVRKGETGNIVVEI
ncbi:zinc-dependent alcohol dehydrogenase family protein [Chitinophaga rhizophila]|uniref:Zinc-dependent alcohol dehydrogenase family protein n=1 Tax=Chitinophaga rhizophila TaxID=2866212 RepID=A0ABS7GE64_9BACT|nr:zinc-dependent alcohol dehydrogenase family protein [Chitinophaga rhizophila]MBW8684977.1 zinc-dependent alcohol dehydrogenase family protein [Chitinophaga rhizophila]